MPSNTPHSTLTISEVLGLSLSQVTCGIWVNSLFIKTNPEYRPRPQPVTTCLEDRGQITWVCRDQGPPRKDVNMIFWRVWINGDGIISECCWFFEICWVVSGNKEWIRGPGSWGESFLLIASRTQLHCVTSGSNDKGTLGPAPLAWALVT